MIQVSAVTSKYGDTLVLNEISTEFSDKEFTVIAGPNGAGKSTLLYAVMGFLEAVSGEIKIFGRALGAYKRPALAKLISFVPQETVFSFDFTVEELVLMGRYPYMGLMQSWTEEDRQIAADALRMLGLEGFGSRWYSTLSGGEKQRVLIARALAQQTRFMFLDESLSQLDINHQLEIMRLLAKICREKEIGIVLVSHNLNLAANFADKMIFLKAGKVIGSGKPTVMMTGENLFDLYGVLLEIAQNPLTGIPNLVYPGINASEKSS